MTIPVHGRSNQIYVRGVKVNKSQNGVQRFIIGLLKAVNTHTLTQQAFFTFIFKTI